MFAMEKSEGKRPLGRPGSKKINTFKWLLNQQDVRMWIELIRLRIWSRGRLF
jgi:hypothetical protein